MFFKTTSSLNIMIIKSIESIPPTSKTFKSDTGCFSTCRYLIDGSKYDLHLPWNGTSSCNTPKIEG